MLLFISFILSCKNWIESLCSSDLFSKSFKKFFVIFVSNTIFISFIFPFISAISLSEFLNKFLKYSSISFTFLFNSFIFFFVSCKLLFNSSSIFFSYSPFFCFSFISFDIESSFCEFIFLIRSSILSFSKSPSFILEERSSIIFNVSLYFCSIKSFNS